MVVIVVIMKYCSSALYLEVVYVETVKLQFHTGHVIKTSL
jgi:hypothetical protein